MNKAQLPALLDDIRKGSDKATIYRKLVKIRTDVIDTDGGMEQLAALDGIQLLVGLLSKPYEKVLEVVLSILGNCCLRKDCSTLAFDAGILNPLVSIISNIPNPSIQCRGCRLLGNLAQQPSIAYTIGKDNGNTAYALNSILGESENTAVLVMAIRAIRQLWPQKPFRTVVISQGGVGKIMQLLLKFSRNDVRVETTAADAAASEMDQTERVVIKRLHAPDRTITKEKFRNIVRHMENSHLCDIVGYQLIENFRWKDPHDFKMPESKETAELFVGILKCLQMVTTMVSPRVAEEIYGENGCGMKCLVFLCSENSQFRALSLKIVSNLASNPDAIDKLTACDVITMASDLIMHAKLDDSEKRYCVSVICLLTKEACNRGHIRRSGALQAFMKIAKQSSDKRELAMIQYALYQYRFDNLSFEILLSNGLVSFLVGILNEILGEKEVSHIKHDDEETMSASIYSKRRSSNQRAKLKRSDVLFHYKNFAEVKSTAGSHYYTAPKMAKLDPYCSAPESPESGSSGYASTSYGMAQSPYSSNSSPQRTGDDVFDDTEIYSPVCSDHEDDNEQDEPDEVDGIPAPSAAVLANDSDQEDDAEQTDNAGKATEFDILTYLYDDNSNACLTADGQEPAVQEEEPHHGFRSMYSFDDSIDDNEIHDIELEIVSSKAFERYPMQPILTLLWSISKSMAALEFVQAGTLETLLRICKRTKKPRGRAFQTLANIINQVNHFLPLLKHDFVFRLHELKTPYPSHGRCWSCDEMKSVCNELMTLFGTVGETGYGQGEIAHILQTGDRDLQLRVCIIVMFVIRDVRLLHKLLFDMKVLDTVMTIILNEDDEQRLCNVACSGITRLAQNLYICGEEEDTGTPSERLAAKEFDNTLTICDETAGPEDKVTFKVRNAAGQQETVMVSKSLLTEGSDVFERMFNGDHFIESKNNEVNLQECISADGLRYFFYLIRLQTVNKLNGMAPPPKAVEDSLDALNLSQKYLLPVVEKSVLNIVKTLLNDDCVLNVFEWSLRHYNQELLVASTYYFLYSDISGAAKCKLYRAANRSCYRDEWRRLLTETILFRLQPNLE